MPLDLHVHAEVNVGVFLPGGHWGVLHRVYVHAVHVCVVGVGGKQAGDLNGGPAVDFSGGERMRLPLTLTVM